MLPNPRRAATRTEAPARRLQHRAERRRTAENMSSPLAWERFNDFQIQHFQKSKTDLNSLQRTKISVSFRLEHEKLGFVQNPARNTRYAASGKNWICILSAKRNRPDVQRTGRTSREPAASAENRPHESSTDPKIVKKRPGGGELRIRPLEYRALRRHGPWPRLCLRELGAISQRRCWHRAWRRRSTSSPSAPTT